MAQAAAANLLIQGLTDKGVKIFGKAMKDQKDFQEAGGYDSMSSMYDQMNGMLSNFSPLSPGLALLSANFTNETMQSNLALMNSFLQLIQSDGMQTAIRGMAELMNSFLDKSTAVLNIGTAIANLDFSTILDDLQALGEPSDWFRGITQQWNDFIGDLMNAFDFTFGPEQQAELAENIRSTLKTFWDQWVEFWEGVDWGALAGALMGSF